MAILRRMSRVPADTVLFRALVAAALSATLALSACGGDDPETATTPGAAPAATTVTGTTEVPVTSSPGGDEPAPVTNDNAKDEPTREESEAAIARTEKAAKEASEGLSSKPKSTDDLTQQVKKANDALKAAGYKVAKPTVSGEESVALTVNDNLVTIVFLRSPRDAAASQAGIETNFAKSPQKMKLARKANRLFILSLPTDPSASQLKQYREVRKIVNGAV